MLGDATTFAEENEARAATLEVLPATRENAFCTSEVLDKLKEQDGKRTAAQSALGALTQNGAVTKNGGARGATRTGTFFLPKPPRLPAEGT